MGERTHNPLGTTDPGLPVDPQVEPAAGSNTEQISAEIEATRADLGDTIDELQERLSPKQIVADAKTAMADAAKEKARDVAHQANTAVHSVASMTREAMDRATVRVRRNPLPLTIVAVNVGMALAMRRWNRHQRSRSRTDPYAYRNSAARAHTESTFKERRGTTMATRHFQHVITDNPVAIGLVAIAAGAAVGLMLPATQVENEYLGDARDSLVDSAKDMAGEAAERVQHAVGQAAEEIASGETPSDDTTV